MKALAPRVPACDGREPLRQRHYLARTPIFWCYLWQRSAWHLCKRSYARRTYSGVCHLFVTVERCVLLGSLAEAWSTKGHAAFLRVFAKVLAAILGVVAVFVVLLSLVGDWGLTLVFGASIAPYNLSLSLCAYRHGMRGRASSTPTTFSS